MDKNQAVKKVLIQSAIADIAISDLGLTLDEPAFFSPYCSYVEYGIDSEFGNIIRFETLSAMSRHLCMLEGGVDLAIQLAKKSGLLNYKLSDTEYVTEKFIEEGLKNQRKAFISGDVIDYDFQMAIHYQHLFESYCLEFMNEYQLNERIKEKIKSRCNQ